MPASFAVPTCDARRDWCTCEHLDTKKVRRNGKKFQRISNYDRLCPACQAWDDGYVLVDGKKKYLRAMWLQIQRAGLDGVCESASEDDSGRRPAVMATKRHEDSFGSGLL